MASTRDRIVVATNELFRRYGYNGTSLKQISEASEATIGSIYHFFPGGKEDLGVAVIETTGDIYRQLFESIMAEGDDAPAGLEAFFVAAGDVLEQSDYIDPCPIGTIAREAANTSEPLRQAADRAFQSWIDSAASHLAGTGMPPDEAAELATLFVSTLEGCFVVSRARRDPAPLVSGGHLLAKMASQAIESVDRLAG